MKKNKAIISIIAAAAMLAVSISGCSNNKETVATENKSSEVQSSSDAQGSSGAENADTQKPVFTIANTTFTVTAGDSVNLLDGVTASDETDGDLTAAVTADETGVDYNTPGEYTAYLNVADKSGNSETAEIKVVVKEKTNEVFNPTSELQIGDLSQYSTEKVPYGVGTNMDPETNRPTGLQWYENTYGQYDVDFILPQSNYMYLTFDEGYENGYTGTILDTLKEKNVKAVFFITMPYVKENPDLVQRMIDEGHVVGNHTVTHPSDGLQSLSVEDQINEVKEVNDYVLENFGYQMTLFRFPTGAFSEQSLAIVQSLGYRSVFWSFAYRDWVVEDQMAYDDALNSCLTKAHGGAIYLLHAVSETNTQILGEFIDKARENGYEFGSYANIN